MIGYKVIGPGNGILPRANMYLATPAPLDYAAANTYEPIPGTWAGDSLKLFTVTAAGVLTYQGPSNSPMLFVGTSDLETSKSTTLYYGLFKNGVVLTRQQTTVAVPVAEWVNNISINGIITLNYGDQLQIQSKCVDETVIMTPHSLSVTLWGRAQ